MTRPIPLKDLDVVENGLPEPTPAQVSNPIGDFAVVFGIICLAIFI